MIVVLTTPAESSALCSCSRSNPSRRAASATYGAPRVLTLERRQQADRLGRVERAALQQQLPCGQRRGQLRPSERTLGQLVESDAAAERTASPGELPGACSTTSSTSRRPR